MYKVIWKDQAEKNLSKLDKVIAKKIFDKVETYLAQDPINRGESLAHEYQGFYRYRFSNYRIIYQVNQKELSIVVIKIGHRREVYQ